VHQTHWLGIKAINNQMDMGRYNRTDGQMPAKWNYFRRMPAILNSIFILHYRFPILAERQNELKSRKINESKILHHPSRARMPPYPRRGGIE
jgi:hypothetical protein